MVMRVPEYNQQFRYDSPQVPAARLQGMQVQTNSAMFGGESGRQMEKAGYLMQRGANQLSHLVDDYNTTKAQNAATQLQQGFLEWQSETQKKQGEAGMNTAADYDTWANTKREELTKGLNDVQRGRFESLANMQDARFRHWAEGYGHQQGQEYHISTQKGRVSNNTDMLIKNIHEPDLAEIAVEQLHAAGLRLSELKGNSRGSEAEQAIVRETVSGALVPAIHARIQAGETGLASALMKQYEGQLGGAAMAQLGADNKRMQEHQAAQARTRAAEARYAQAESTANSYWAKVDSGDMTASQALLEMRNTIKDPRLQRDAMGIFTQLSQPNRMAEEEDATKARSKASDDFDKTGGDINAMWEISQKANRIALSETASKADKQYAKQAKALYDNAVQFNDPAIKSGSKPEAYEDILGGIANGTYTSEAALKSSEQWPYLTPVGRKTALATLKEDQGFEMQEAKTMFKSWFRENRGREYSATKDKGMMDDAMSFVQKRIQGSNRGKEPGYVQKALDLFVMSSTVPDSGTFWDDTEEYGVLNKQGKALPVVPEDMRGQIEVLFNNNLEMRNAFMTKYGNFHKSIRGYFKEMQEKELGPRKKQQGVNYE